MELSLEPGFLSGSVSQQGKAGLLEPHYRNVAEISP
jgi:hypothetical protein